MERLHPDDIEAIAQRVAELLRAEVAQPEYLTAAQVAERFGVSRSFVYEHSTELGAVRLGKGPKPPLRFDAERVQDALTTRAAPPVPQPTPRRTRRAQPPPRRLLPIRGEPVPLLAIPDHEP